MNTALVSSLAPRVIRFVTAALLAGLLAGGWAAYAADEQYGYIFNDADQLAAVTLDSASVATFAYDGDGLRVKKESGGTKIFYVRDASGNVIAEYDQNGNVLSEYVYAGSKRICKIVDGERFYYHDDIVGTPLVITDGVGNQSFRAENQPFGTEHSSGGAPDRRKFTGKELDTEFGLFYFNARYYDSNLGRFISVDPVGGDNHHPQSWNRYAYALNNPLKYIDLTGESPNQAAATDPSRVLTEIRSIEGTGVGEVETLKAVSRIHLEWKVDRYFYTRKYGWVDIRHFSEAARYSFEYGELVAEVLGFGNEIKQELDEGERDYQSAFSPEDLPSNAAGADFGSNYLDGNVSVRVAFMMWAEDAGAVPKDHPDANTGALPPTDASWPLHPAHRTRRPDNSTSEPVVAP